MTTISRQGSFAWRNHRGSAYERGLDWLLRIGARPWWRRVPLALLIVSAASILAIAYAQWVVPARGPLLILLSGVIVAVAATGLAGALVALTVGMLVAAAVFLQGPYAESQGTGGDIAILVLFGLAALLATVLYQAIAHARNVAEANARRRTQLYGQLQVAHELFDAFQRAAPAGMAVLDASMRVLQANPFVAPLLRESPADGHGPIATLNAPLAEAIRPAVRSVLESGVAAPPFEVSARCPGTKGGAEPCQFIARVFPVPGADGEVRRAGLVLQDVTAERRMLRAVQEASAAKDEFLAMVSHEWRTPLTILVGNATVLDRCGEQLSPAEREVAIDDVLANAERLREMVENMLTLATLERPRGSGDEPLLLHHIVGETADAFARQHRGVNLAVHVNEGVPPALGDPAYVRQLVQNLITNAAKYGPEGAPIDVRISASGGEVRVEVLDCGPGIPREELEGVFQPFRRLPAASTTPGLGLGLTVVRRLAEVQGGRAWAARRPGGGSIFGFAVPALAPGELAPADDDDRAMA